ncbi:MAG: GAF domain-containing protein [Bacteroidota bacterium]
MAETLITADQHASKNEKYTTLLPQLKALTEGETDLIANVSNILAALKEVFGFLWIGVYFVKGNELVLGPFQGPVACTRIGYGKGVCGACWEQKEIIIVPDVDQFPGHIACSSLSRSEIVLPVFVKDEIVMILDIDSEQLSTFDEEDSLHLQQVTSLIASFF